MAHDGELAREFQSFLRACYGQQAITDEQLEHIENAFYAGARSMQSATARSFETWTYTPEGRERIAGIAGELEDFGIELQRRAQAQRNLFDAP